MDLPIKPSDCKQILYDRGIGREITARDKKEENIYINVNNISRKKKVFGKKFKLKSI